MKKVKVVNGVPYFEVDGETVVPAAYMTYLTENADYKAFSRSGFKLYCITVAASEFPINEETGLKKGFSQPTWIDDGVYDFSSLNEDIRKLIADSGNNDVKIILRINLNMPSWWRKRYPNELTLYDDGTTRMQSISSLRWRIDAGEYLKALKMHLDDSGYAKNVIAWQPAAMHTEEWIAPIRRSVTEDYSEPAQNAFKAYCTQKYGLIDALNSAWNSSYNSFDCVRIPNKAEREYNGEYVRDYFRFKNDAYAEAAEYFCAYVKRLFDGDIFVGCFGGYVGQLTKYHGHCSFSKLLRSKNIDFFASPFAYTDGRRNAVDWFYHSPIESTRLAGKLWFIEADVRTSSTKLLSESAPWLFDEPITYYDAPVWKGPDKQNSLRNILRSFSKVFISRNAFWWFDMWGGWFVDSDFAVLIEKTRALYEKEVATNIPSASEIAVILDEEYAYYASDDTCWESVYCQIVTLGFLGAPYDLLLRQNLKTDSLEKYKAVIFLAPSPTNENAALIDGLRTGGKTVMVSGDEFKKFSGEEKAYTELQLQSAISESCAFIYSAGNIVYANGKYLSITARCDGTLTVNMPFDCELVDCISGKTLKTEEKRVVLCAEENQTFLWEILR